MRSYLLNIASEKINILIQSPLHMFCLQIQSHSEVLGVWASAQEFGRTGWGTQFAHLLHPGGAASVSQPCSLNTSHSFPESPNFVSKGPDSQYFTLRHNYLTLSLKYKRSHRLYVNKWVLLGPDKTIHGHQDANFIECS